MAAFAHRKLRCLDGYLPTAALSSNGRELPSALPGDAGELVGCYLNQSDDPSDWIVITSRGMSIPAVGARHFIYYSELEGTTVLAKSLTSDDIQLIVRDRPPVTLKIKGHDRDRGTHDKYAIAMFIDHVLSRNAGKVSGAGDAPRSSSAAQLNGVSCSVGDENSNTTSVATKHATDR